MMAKCFDEIFDKIGGLSYDINAGSRLQRDCVYLTIHRSDLTDCDVQSEHTQLLRRIGRRKSTLKTLAVGIARVNETDFWLLHHGAQMFRDRARLCGDRRQRTKIVIIGGCQIVGSRASRERWDPRILIYRPCCERGGAEIMS